MQFFKKIKNLAYNKKKNNFVLTLSSKLIFFLGLFLISFVLLYVLFVYSGLYNNLSGFFAQTVYNHFSYNSDITLAGTTIDFKAFEINITSVCSGVYELIVFLALIFACFEIKLWKRVVGALFYFVFFVVFNFIRMITVIYSFAYFDLFSVDLLHTLLFKFGFFIITFLFFLYFLIIAD